MRRRGRTRGRRTAPAAVLRRVDLQPCPAHLPAARAGLPRLPGRDRARPGSPRPVERGLRAEEGRQRDPGAGRRPGDPPGQPPRRRLLPRAHHGRAGPLARAAAPGAGRRAGHGARGWPASTSPTSSSTTNCSALHDGERYAIERRRGSRATSGCAVRRQPSSASSRSSARCRTPPRCTRRLDGGGLPDRPAGPLHAEFRPAVTDRPRGCGRRRAWAPSAATRSAASSSARSRRSTRSRRRCGSSARTSRPARPYAACRRAPGVGHGVSEAPRGRAVPPLRARRGGPDPVVGRSSRRPRRTRRRSRMRPAPGRRSQPRPRRRCADRDCASARSATTTRASPARPTSST